ncbi:hypothetical protein U1Q18_015150 [Sarracenia purpurea var. burkii]
MTTRSKALRLKEAMSRSEDLNRGKGTTIMVSPPSLGINPSALAVLEEGSTQNVETLSYDNEALEEGMLDEEDDAEQEEGQVEMDTFVLRAEEGDGFLLIEKSQQRQSQMPIRDEDSRVVKASKINPNPVIISRASQRRDGNHIKYGGQGGKPGGRGNRFGAESGFLKEKVSEDKTATRWDWMRTKCLKIGLSPEVGKLCSIPTNLS